MSNNILQMSQYHGDPRYLISPQQAHPLYPQQVSGLSLPSVPSSRPVLSPPASQYAPDEHTQNSAVPQFPSLPQYADSQVTYQQPYSYHLTATTPNGHPVSNQRYSERVNTTSSRGVGRPVSGGQLLNYNEGNSGWSSTDGLDRQNVQVSSVEPYGYGYNQAQQRRTEQGIMYQPNAVPGLNSHNDFSGQCQADATCENAWADDTSPDFSATMDNNFGRGSDSQLMGNQANPTPNFFSGIDPSLINHSDGEASAQFSADVDETHAGDGGTQNGGLLRNSDDLDSPIGSSNFMFSRSGTVSGTVSRAASSTAPRSCGHTRTHAHRRAGHRTDQPVSSGSSITTCDICENDPNCARRPAYSGSADSQKSSLRRHKKLEHFDGQHWSYQCSIDKDGSPCGKSISRADNRRKHVEKVHPTMELPPKDAATRTSNDTTNARLDEWIPKVPQST